jgi:transcriptional regulator
MLQAMYLPPQFKGDREKAAALIQENPFASLISIDDAGLPYVTHLPLHLEEHPSTLRQAQDGPSSGHPDFMLLGHVAKPNPHWRYLQARPQAVVTFLGPHAYLSPKVYPDLARVPTWNYLAVHCTVQATLIEDPSAKDALLKKLIGDHEPPYAQQWRDLGEEFAHKMLAGIVGFELRVTDLPVQGQNQPAQARVSCRHESDIRGRQRKRTSPGQLDGPSGHGHWQRHLNGELICAVFSASWACWSSWPSWACWLKSN